MKRRATNARHLLKPESGTSGFTFVEILIALTVGAIVIAGMYQGFNTLHKWWISAGIRSDMRQNARAGLETVTRDLEMAGYKTTPYGDINKTGLAITIASTHEIEMDQQRPDSTTIGEAIPVYEPRLVYYHLATDMRTGRQNLYRQIRSQPGLPAPDELVAENVATFTLGYLDKENKKFKAPGDPDNPADLPDPPYHPGTRYATGTVPAQYSFGSPPPAVLKDIRRIQVTLTTIAARAVPFGPAPKPFTLTASVMPQNLAAADEVTPGCTPPSVPTGLAVVESRSCKGGFQVKWDPVTEQYLGGYLLYYGPTDYIQVSKDNVQVTLSPSDLLITRHADRLSAPNTYAIQVLAYSSSDLDCRSEKSAPVAANPSTDVTAFGGGNDTTINPAKPRPPAGFSVSARANEELEISWDAAGADDVVGYRLYRGTAPFVSGAHIDGSLQIARETTLTAAVTTFNDTNLQACESGHPRTYYYAVAAVNCDETLFNEVGAAGYHYNSSAALSDYAVASGSPLAPSLPEPKLDGSQAEEQRVLITLNNLAAESPDFDRTEISWNKSPAAPPHLDGTVVVGGTLIPASDSNSSGIFKNRGNQVIVFDSDPDAAPVEPGAIYNFLAVSFDRCGNVSSKASGPWTIPESGNCTDDPAFPPQDFFTNGTINTCRPDSVVLGWQYPDTLTVPDLAGFRINRTRTDVSDEKELTAAPTALRSWTDAGSLVAGAAYTYTVTATDCVYERYLLDPGGSPLPYDLSAHPLQTLVLGPVSPGGLRLYGVSSGDPEFFVTTESDGMDPVDPLTFTFHNNVKFWLQNTSGNEITIEKMALAWENPNLVLARVVIGGAPSSTPQGEIFDGAVASGAEFAVHDAVIKDKAAAAGALSVVVPVRLRFTTTNGSVNRLVDMRREVLRISLWVKNSGFTAACSDPTEVTVEVPRGPELGSFSQSAPGRDGTDSYAVMGPSGTASDTDIKVSTGVGVNVYGTAVDHSGMLFPDGVNRGFVPPPALAGLKVYGISAAAATGVPIRMPSSGTPFVRPLYSLGCDRAIGGDRYAVSQTTPTACGALMPQVTNNVHWYYALAVDKTGNWDRLPNPDYGNYAYFQTNFNICSYTPREPVLSGATPTADHTGVVLVWVAPTLYTDATPIVSDDVLTYDVYYNKDGSGWVLVPGGANRSSVRYDHGSLSAGTYRYIVKAKNSCFECAGTACPLPPSCAQDGCCSACSTESSSVVIP